MSGDDEAAVQARVDAYVRDAITRGVDLRELLRLAEAALAEAERTTN